MEMVSDPHRKTPVSKEVAQAAFDAAYEAGVTVRVSGNNMICSPPLIVTEKDTADILDGLEAGLKTAQAMI